MKTLNEIFQNDKVLVILCIFGITLYSIYIFGVGAKEIVTNAFSGLFGIAVGRALTQTDRS
jgi:hypothetical protein